MLDLSNLSTELKILLIVIVGGAMGFANHRLNTNQTAKPIILAVIVVAAVYLMYTSMNQESFQNTPSPSENEVSLNETPMINDEMGEMNNVNDEDDVISLNNNQNMNPNVSGSYGVDNDETYKEVSNNVDTNQLPNECYPKDILSPKELLPKDSESTWAQSVPSSQGALTDQNFLNAGYHIGVNTVGQTLRNANRQLRSDPPCPRTKVSPWLQSTIEPDTNRKPLEIGA